MEVEQGKRLEGTLPPDEGFELRLESGGTHYISSNAEAARRQEAVEPETERTVREEKQLLLRRVGDEIWNLERMAAEYKDFQQRPATPKRIGINRIYAKALEAFANLKHTPKEVRLFQQMYGGFFPPSFFSRNLPSLQELYGCSLLSGAITPDGKLLPGLSSQPIPLWVAYQNTLCAAFHGRFDDSYVLRLLGAPTLDYLHDPFARQLGYDVLPTDKALSSNNGAFPFQSASGDYQPKFPFQNVILSLKQAKWRVKVCTWCRKPLIANRPNQQFHAREPDFLEPGKSREVSCFAEHRAAFKEAWEKEKRAPKARFRPQA